MSGRPTRYTGWTRALVNAGTVVILAAGAACVGGLVAGSVAPGSALDWLPPPEPAAKPSPTYEAPFISDDKAAYDWQTVGHWYCWDAGPLNPHHLGRHVRDDHMCTWGELREHGFVS